MAINNERSVRRRAPSAPLQVYIYAGPATSLVSSVLAFHNAHCLVFLLASSQVMDPAWIPHASTPAWMHEADIFVMPGGADRFYCHCLNGAPNSAIQRYVHQGGVYVGVCAGAYYGASYVEFDKGLQSEVSGARELAFYPGKAVGPLAPYDYYSNSGARAARISLFGKHTCLYYNGGCAFAPDRTALEFKESNEPNTTNTSNTINASNTPNITITQNTGHPLIAPCVPHASSVHVLGEYVDREHAAAIVELQIGAGTALLSGVHFEVSAEMLNANDPNLAPIIPQLAHSEPERKHLFQYVLSLAKEAAHRFSYLSPPPPTHSRYTHKFIEGFHLSGLRLS